MKKISSAAALAALAFGAMSAQARPALPFSTGFEASEGYTNNTQLASNSNWTGDGQDSSGWLVTNSSVGGSGASSGTQWVLASSPTASTTRFQWTVTPVTDFSTDHAVFGSCDVKLASPSSGTINRSTLGAIQMYDAAVDLMAQLSLIQDTQALAGGPAGEMYVELDFGDTTGVIYDLGVTNALNQYIKLGLAIDFTTDTVYGYVNGTQLPDTGSAGGHTDFHDFDLVAGRLATTAGGTAARAGFDNYEVHTGNVPAPATAAMLGIGGLVAGRRRRA